MNRELFEKTAASRLTRRKIVTTGTKLAYAAPLVAASFKLNSMVASAEITWVWMDILTLEEQGYVITNDPPCKVVICHATCSESGGNTHVGYSAIEIPSDCNLTPEQALAAHLLDPQHQNGCQEGRTDVLPRSVVEDKKLAECPDGGTGGPSPV